MLPLFSPFYKRLLLAGALALTLVGCAGQVSQDVRRLPERVELSGVPFFRGNANQSAPMALASILSQQGVGITPGLLEKPLGLPAGINKLQGSMEAVARDYGMVVYPLDNSLAALLAQVAAGNPVLVRYSDGALWGEPRYALLVGYDRFKQRVLLRSGNSRRMPIDFDSFASAWKSEGSWAVLVQRPEQLPAQVDRQRWLKAANDLAQAGQEQAAARATKAIGAQ
ncbi:peptidase C39 family protein [Pseudomonas sp. R5(2019)]|uniref:peptidase C39 family protein n=1 Tax=Pseudomonas sp. R5(2019) TaxID=2697566 RepID=UPI001412107C|nr:peptidase C39 family protein [Pseudomonas sp. R5(2019)]NBA95575.1 peptidase C39 family protein [Pseudomonas sp. R5(2019)]